MGNSLGGMRLLNNGDCSYHVQLGKSTTIELTERKVERKDDGQFEEKWEASYTVDGSTCVLSVIKGRKVGEINGESLHISLHDDICAKGGLHVNLYQGAEAGLLEVGPMPAFCGSFYDMMSFKNSTTINAWGGVTSTTVYSYGHGTRGGLFVTEYKRKNMRDQKPYMGTLAHYLATNTSNLFSKTDIGLSVVAKIRVSDNGSLDFAVEGPVQHPAPALFYMFDEVLKTGVWKPTACPHCANNSIIQKQRNMFWQSESEDTDNLPAARPHSRGQNAASLLSNDGEINGNHNGNFIVRNLLLRLRGR